uniref:Uncharacterized protein n=1 Tax=Compsopogon caeruleus TaxID=31354 RepID=A0A7S1XA31_9RHOD|mmetsp:Transcript_10104/g.20445  ORF Transcript_10104/g.20445 Transcript_10104/m.20445 type:complete len:480 (+) Transcript_10104:178-1617(+)
MGEPSPRWVTGAGAGGHRRSHVTGGMALLWLFPFLLLFLESACVDLGDKDRELAFFLEDILSESAKGALSLPSYESSTRFAAFGRRSLWSQLPSQYVADALIDSLLLPRANIMSFGISAQDGKLARFLSIHHVWHCYSKYNQDDPRRWNSDPKPAVFSMALDEINSTIRTWPSGIDNRDSRGGSSIGQCLSPFELRDSELGLNRTWTASIKPSASTSKPLKGFETKLNEVISSQSKIDDALGSIFNLFRLFFQAQLHESEEETQFAAQVDVSQLHLLTVSNITDISLSRNLGQQNISSQLYQAVGTIRAKSNTVVSGNFLVQNNIRSATDSQLALASAAALSGILLDFEPLDTSGLVTASRRKLGNLIRLITYFSLVVIDVIPLSLLFVQELQLSRWTSPFVGSSGIYSLLDGGGFSKGTFSKPEGRSILLFFELGYMKLLLARPRLVGIVLGLTLTIRGFFFFRRAGMRIIAISLTRT